MKIVALTGAGISQPSGLATFRDAGGLWEGHRFEEVASPEGWRKRPQRVLDFYNARRVQLGTVRPNAAHLALAAWQEDHEVVIVTQNVDDLHERAGSRNVMHLHGRLTEVRSTKDETWVKDIGYTPINLGDRCPIGGQLRPHIVWFGEQVPNMPFAEKEVASADVVLVIGTSLQVYPAAGLTEFARADALRILVDPKPERVPEGFRTVTASAEIGVPSLASLFS
jgi:NAD-dependent deacetylase